MVLIVELINKYLFQFMSLCNDFFSAYLEDY